MAENLKLGTFDECVEALTRCAGDIEAACQIIFDKQ